MKTFVKMLVASVAAIGLGCVLIAYDASDKAVLATMFASAIMLSLVLGVFDIKSDERTIHQNIKDAARYRKAA